MHPRNTHFPPNVNWPPPSKLLFFLPPMHFLGSISRWRSLLFFLMEMKLAGLRRVFRQVKPTPFPSPNQTLRWALPRKKYSLYLEESHPLNFKKRTPPPLFPYLQRLLCVIFSLRLFVRISHPPFLGRRREGKERGAIWPTNEEEGNHSPSSLHHMMPPPAPTNILSWCSALYSVLLWAKSCVDWQLTSEEEKGGGGGSVLSLWYWVAARHAIQHPKKIDDRVIKLWVSFSKGGCRTRKTKNLNIGSNAFTAFWLGETWARLKWGELSCFPENGIKPPTRPLPPSLPWTLTPHDFPQKKLFSLPGFPS